MIGEPPQRILEAVTLPPSESVSFVPPQCHAGVICDVCRGVESGGRFDGESDVSAVDEKFPGAVIEEQPQQIIGNRGHGVELAEGPL
ncbi:hypothetical protein [Nocardia sp. NPDC006630]|uniref:hypothetical protein n=1 Tax=Nocardia sp. NPDC006630 TaxID=3157181 RepID=UPI0033BA45E4